MAQAIWLSQAYRLEMLGESVYLRVWAASILFLFIQTFVLAQLLLAYRAPAAMAEQKMKKAS